MTVESKQAAAAIPTNGDVDLRLGVDVHRYPLFALWPFLWAYKSRAGFALLALILASAAMLGLPIAVREIFDSALWESAAVGYGHFVIFALVSLVLALSTAWRFYLVSTLGERVVADVRKKIFKHVLALDSYQCETLKVGELLSRLTTDTALIEQTVSTSISMVLRNAINLLGSGLMLVYTSWRLTLLVSVVTPLLLVPMLAVLRRSRQLARMSQDKLAQTNAYAGEVFFALAVVKAFTHEHEDKKMYSAAIESTYDAARKRIRLRSVFTIIITLSICVAAMLVLWVGSRLVLSAVISQGELAQFLIYSAIAATSAAALSEVWNEVLRASAACERVWEILSLHPSIQDCASPKVLSTPILGKIGFENVYFSYPSRPKATVLAGIDFAINPGSTLALVGSSGAGKSTIVQLLLRLYDIQRGQITLDGVAIEQLQLAQLRAAMSIVPQEVVVFSGTIYDNILYGRPDAQPEEVHKAAKLALVDDFVTSLPEAYMTLVGERGMRLSGGQRQRIAIARAFLRDSPILLLDEATSALDAESERLVQLALAKLMKNRTTLVIAHRLATIQQADEIIFLAEGVIQERGRHEQLLKRSKAYAHLAKLQFLDGHTPIV